MDYTKRNMARWPTAKNNSQSLHYKLPSCIAMAAERRAITGT